MLKAKALCAVEGNTASEIRPLMSITENPVVADIANSSGLKQLVSNMQNIVIESVGTDIAIPIAVSQLAVRMMKDNAIIKDLAFYIRMICYMFNEHYRISTNWMRAVIVLGIAFLQDKKSQS